MEGLAIAFVFISGILATIEMMVPVLEPPTPLVAGLLVGGNDPGIMASVWNMDGYS